MLLETSRRPPTEIDPRRISGAIRQATHSSRLKALIVAAFSLSAFDPQAAAATFKAIAGDAAQGAVTWSVATYVSDWLPRYLEACARDDKNGIVVNGRPSDRALRRCAGALAKLIRDRTRHASYAEVGALLFAAFPRNFHVRASETDDHAEAARALLRRAHHR